MRRELHSPGHMDVYELGLKEVLCELRHLLGIIELAAEDVDIGCIAQVCSQRLAFPAGDMETHGREPFQGIKDMLVFPDSRVADDLGFFWNGCYSLLRVRGPNEVTVVDSRVRTGGCTAAMTSYLFSCSLFIICFTFFAVRVFIEGSFLGTVVISIRG